jgi:hypothetical protein
LLATKLKYTYKPTQTMSKLSIFSVLLVGSLLVAPVVTANNYASISKSAKAQSLESSVSSSSSINSNSSTLLLESSNFNSSDLSSSSILDLSFSQSSALQSDSSRSATTRTKIITDVKPVRLNAQSTNWWKETDLFAGGNSADLGNDAINTQIQTKLQTQCPNIYDSVAKTINETNLANCQPINNLPIQKIAVIDSGVTANAEMMPYMDQVSSWNFFTSVNYPTICTATSPLRFYTLVQGAATTYYCKEKGTQSDTDYHGTVVALTAIRTYQNNLLKNRIKIVPYSLRTLDTINISDSIDEVVREGDIKTINFALGTPFNLSYVEDSINLANAAGINIYDSSGNCAIYSPSSCDYNGNTVQDLPEEANNAPDYPAAYANVVMVGSSNYSDNNIAGIIRATYSNFVTSIRNNFVMAPVGNSGIILPCFLNCQGAANYSYLGTSFASPQASALDGLVASYARLMKLNLSQPNEQVLVSTDTAKQYVTSNTTDILSAGNDLQSGTGLINLKKISDKIVSQLQTLNIPASSSSQVVSSSLLSSSSSILPSSLSSPIASSSIVAKNTIINSITLNQDNSAYIVTATSNFTPAFGSDHVHFYYNTEANTIMNKMFSTSGPYTILVSTKPTDATQLCSIVGTPSHGIYPNTGNCVNLPTIPQISSSSAIQSSSILSSSSNVPSSSAIISSSSTVSSLPIATPASSSQVSSSSQAVSSSVAQSSSSSVSSSSQSVISSSLISTSSSSSTSQSSAIANSGGGVISIITNLVSNVINAITGANANLNGNTALVNSSSSVANSSNSKSQEIAIKEQGVKLSQDAAFAGLINNQSGIAIREQDVKAPQVQVKTQSDFAIKEQGVKITDNQEVSSSISSNIKDETCKKGYEYYKACDDTSACKKGINEKGLPFTQQEETECSLSIESCKKGITEKGISNISDQNSECLILQPSCDKGIQEKGLSNKANSECETVKSECKKGIKEKGLSNKSDSDAECGSANQECKKGWDGSIKGGLIAQDCISPIGFNPQSDVNSGNDLGKYIPIVVIALVGTLGVLAVNGWVQKMQLQKVISAGAQLIGGAMPQSAAVGSGELVGANCATGGNRAINTKGAGTNSVTMDSASESVSNVLKTKHDTVKNSISNVR